MKKYYKEEDGKRVWFDGILRMDGVQVINPTEEMILAEGWIEYIPPTPIEPTAEELLEQAKARKLDELHDYDESSEVNDCIIIYQGQELHYWADKHERDSLKNAVRDCITMGRTTYRLDLRDLGVSLFIECEKLIMMLSALEVYAIDCYNKTTDHEFAIKALPTIEDVDAYKFIGYPEKLRFEV